MEKRVLVISAGKQRDMAGVVESLRPMGLTLETMELSKGSLLRDPYRTWRAW